MDWTDARRFVVRGARTARGSAIAFVALVACTPASEPGAKTPDAPAAPAPAAASELDDGPAAAPVSAPIDVPAARAAHEVAQTAMHGEPLADDPRVHFVPIENPPGDRPALAAFHHALRALEDGSDADGKVRIAAYGASSTASDRYVAYLRHYFQARFGDAGPGFVAAVPLWKWHRHDRVRAEANRHWTIEHAQKKTGRLDGLYGLLGASASAAHKFAKASVTARTRGGEQVDSIELWFLSQPGGGTMRVTAGGVRQDIPTAAGSVGAAYHEVPLPGPAPLQLDIKAKGDGEVRLFGAVFERDAKGVVVDTLGIGGTRITNHVDWDEPMWREGIQRRAPDLYTLAYGANESVDEDEDYVQYRDKLEAAVGRFRQAIPAASCVLIGPQDFPQKDETGEEVQYVSRPRISEIIAMQREVAAARGCGFFDTRAMMGGEGSMNAWVDQEPTLGRDDHLHLTPLGYGYLGRTLADALMAEYDAP